MEDGGRRLGKGEREKYRTVGHDLCISYVYCRLLEMLIVYCLLESLVAYQ